MASLTERGVLAGRFIRCMAMGKGKSTAAIAYAQGQNFSGTPQLVEIIRGTVLPNEFGDGLGAPTPNAILADLRPLLTNYSILDRLTAARRAPLNVKIPAYSGGATAQQVGEYIAVPMSAATFALMTLAPMKIASAIVTTNELLKFSSPTGEAALANQMAKAVGLASDFRAMSPDLSDSLAAGATTYTSAGKTVANIDADVVKMINALLANGDESLNNAVWVMSAANVNYLASLRNSSNNLAYPTVTMKGGTLAGLPILISSVMSHGDESPGYSNIALVNQNDVTISDSDSILIDATQEASAQIDDAPSSAPASQISFWQHGYTGIMCTRFISFAKRNANSVVFLTSVIWV